VSTVIRTKEETQRLHLTCCPRSIVRDLRKVALEKGVLLHEIAIEAFTEYMKQDKQKELLDKKIVITR
jgi:hypothetical protein